MEGLLMRVQLDRCVVANMAAAGLLQECALGLVAAALLYTDRASSGKGPTNRLVFLQHSSPW